MAYRILDHTADIGIEATAPDIPALFSEAVRATAAIVLDAEPGESGSDPVPVAVEADDLGAALAFALHGRVGSRYPTAALRRQAIRFGGRARPAPPL